MSSFDKPHRFYLFEMKNGKKKLAYGINPEDAYEVLSLRLTPQELAQVCQDQYLRIKQQDLQQYAHELG
jgi:hypothetical protein